MNKLNKLNFFNPVRMPDKSVWRTPRKRGIKNSNVKVNSCTLLTMLSLIILVLFSNINSSYADCTFYVVNNSNIDIFVQAGFYQSKTKPVTFKIDNASNYTKAIKGSETCTSVDAAGLGLAYINLVNPRNSKTNYAAGSWIYKPSSKMFYAVGQSLSSTEGSLGFASDGTQLILLNNYKPDEKTFAVAVKQASRNTTKPASMN
jgi:hypothetical protein